MRRDIYEVLVTQTTYAYIAADTYEAAAADAKEMSFSGPDWEFDTDMHVMKCRHDIDPREPVWTGGPDGDWVPASDLAAAQEEGVR